MASPLTPRTTIDGRPQTAPAETISNSVSFILDALIQRRRASEELRSEQPRTNVQPLVYVPSTRLANRAMSLDDLLFSSSSTFSQSQLQNSSSILQLDGTASVQPQSPSDIVWSEWIHISPTLDSRTIPPRTKRPQTPRTRRVVEVSDSNSESRSERTNPFSDRSSTPLLGRRYVRGYDPDSEIWSYLDYDLLARSSAVQRAVMMMQETHAFLCKRIPFGQDGDALLDKIFDIIEDFMRALNRAWRSARGSPGFCDERPTIEIARRIQLLSRILVAVVDSGWRWMMKDRKIIAN